MGWILAAVGLVQAVDFATFEYGLAASAGHGLPGGEYAGWVQLWIWVPFVTLIAVFLFLLFPDGHLPSPRWRLVGWLGGVFAVTTIAGLAFDPGSDRPDLPALSNPFGVTPAALPFDTAAGLALVLLATQVLRFHTPVAVAAATLVAAALFNPVRGQVQRRVDRRFNRARYDADRAVAAFAARLKDAVDLDSVRQDLTTVVQKALEPAHISVWMNEHG